MQVCLRVCDLSSEHQTLKGQHFKRQSHKMVKHTQTVCQQIGDELFECVWPFCGVGAERVNELLNNLSKENKTMFPRGTSTVTCKTMILIHQLMSSQTRFHHITFIPTAHKGEKQLQNSR